MGLRARAWLSQANLGVKKLTHTTGQAGSLSHGTARSGRALAPQEKTDGKHAATEITECHYGVFAIEKPRWATE